MVDDIPLWVEKYTDDLYSWAFHKISDKDLAADLVQDTFLAALEKMNAFRKDSTPKTWLFSILNHKIIDYYRKRSKQPEKTELELFSSHFDNKGGWLENKLPKDWKEDESHLLDDDEFQLTLKRCMDFLPEKWSTCMKLKYLSDKKGQDICQELNISTTNFWQMVHRAKLQLRDCIEKNWFNQ